MRDNHKARRLTIGEEIRIENRKEFIKAWIYDIGIIALTLGVGVALGYYLGIHSCRI